MFTRFLFKPHESIKVILAILLSVIIITSFSSCAIKNNSEQNHLVYYTLNDEDSLSWIIEKYNKYKLEPEAGEDRKIQLFKNFRSRENVLNITNMVFEDIMLIISM